MSRRLKISLCIAGGILAVGLLLVSVGGPSGTVRPAQSQVLSDIEHVDDVDYVADAEDLFHLFDEVSAEEMVRLVQTERVAYTGIAGSEVYVEFEDGSRYVCQDHDGAVAAYLKFFGHEPAVMANHSMSGESSGSVFSPVWRVMVIFCLLGGIGGLWAKCFLGKTNTESVVANVMPDSIQPAKRLDVPSVKFADVEGVDGLKQDVMRIVDCLKSPDKYREIGARLPRGVILYGPPGTGKTLLAKAIAGEAGVPFFSASGSDFVEKYVGTGARRVRELYARARKAAPCIVFIDEIDAVASRRGRDENSERDQTINALLAELDGFGSGNNVVTICATNRLELLDDAFKRSGRFDLKLAVGLPDVTAREHILQIHARKKKLSDEVSLEHIAQRCVGFSGADLEALLNEAALLAAGRGSGKVELVDLDEAFFKILIHGNKMSRKAQDEMNKVIAWHEAGHTLMTKLLTDDSISTVTIVGSSSGAGGVTFRTPRQEGLQNKKYLRNNICIMYAGRAAEQLLHGDQDLVTTGAAQDIKQATGLIRDYLSLYGMGDMGLLDLSQLRRDYGDIVEEASRLSKELYEQTLSLLTEHKEMLQKLAESLLEHETLNESQIDAILAA